MEFIEKLGLRLVHKFGKHLGMYINELARRKDIGKELISKLNRKPQGWKTGVLSQARRLKLCKTILQNLPTYQ